MTSGQIASWVTVVAALLTYLGVSGIDAATISSAFDGVFALITIAGGIWTAIKHHQAVKAVQASPSALAD